MIWMWGGGGKDSFIHHTGGFLLGAEDETCVGDGMVNTSLYRM